MKKTILSILFPIFLLPVWSQPRPASLSRTIIIDTDCGTDDYRAISIILSRPEIKVSGIITSDGSVEPLKGAEKVSALLVQFGRQDIQVASGKPMKSINPPWRQFCTGVSWGPYIPAQPDRINAADFLARELSGRKEKISLVCMGPLTNIAAALKSDAKILSGVDRIIWYNSSHKPDAGFNYDYDRTGAMAVIASGVRIDIISGNIEPGAYFDPALASLCKEIGMNPAMALNYLFAQNDVAAKLNENHFRLSDELVALYLLTPDLFSITRDMERRNIRYNTAFDAKGSREVLSDLIRGNYVNGENIVFNGFPVNREMFRYDIRPIIDSAIARYGMDEWEANVMTDEFHGHLGVFSIVGAKMGIRARELFGVGPDMLDAVTYAGTRPPYSCLNDGIQVSTGATLGMGTIHLAADSITKPSAVFIYGNRAIRITLKKEYLEQVEKDINEGIVKFGLLDDGYWKLIRRNALKYWIEWDRAVIFEVEETESPLNPGKRAKHN